MINTAGPSPLSSSAAPAEVGAADLAAALAEQERLRRDLHHQVTNSLQIIASLVALQARDSTSDAVRQLHDLIQAQIQTLTLVQRWQYLGEADACVDLAGMLAELCAALEAGLVSARHDHVAIACTAAELSLAPGLAIPVGFLITELALLAGQLAPPGHLQLAVTAALATAGISLIVCTSAFAGSDALAGSDTATARIIRAMAQQLGGRLQHDAVAGRYAIDFSGAAG
jgi:two-component sensor histidine kinase